MDDFLVRSVAFAKTLSERALTHNACWIFS